MIHRLQDPDYRSQNGIKPLSSHWSSQTKQCVWRIKRRRSGFSPMESTITFAKPSTRMMLIKKKLMERFKLGGLLVRGLTGLNTVSSIYIIWRCCLCVQFCCHFIATVFKLPKQTRAQIKDLSNLQGMVPFIFHSMHPFSRYSWKTKFRKS